MNVSISRENEKSFENPGYGIMSSFQVNGKNYVDYYGNVWETKFFEHYYFNVMVDLILGDDHYELPMKVTEELIVAPLESDIPMIEFK
jgi:hypothetical protein